MANTTVSIALPTIGRDLNIEQDRLQWIVSAFSLSSVSMLCLKQLVLKRYTSLRAAFFFFVDD